MLIASLESSSFTDTTHQTAMLWVQAGRQCVSWNFFFSGMVGLKAPMLNKFLT